MKKGFGIGKRSTKALLTRRKTIIYDLFVRGFSPSQILNYIELNKYIRGESPQRINPLFDFGRTTLFTYLKEITKEVQQTGAVDRAYGRDDPW